jgi:hypothetical protein
MIALRRAGRPLEATPKRGELALWAVLAALMTCISGCSLLTIKTPEKPLSARDLNARILTREFSVRFNTSVEQTADRIAAATQDPTIRKNALRWKIAAVGASTQAVSQMAPMLSLLDMWALTVQNYEYLDNGNGRSLFGTQQLRAVTQSEELSREAEQAARSISEPKEFERQQQFIQHYASAYPIQDLTFARASLVALWAQTTGTKTKLVDSLGTVPEAMTQEGDLLRIYGNTLPSQALWRAQLAVQESGISREDVETALKRLDDRLARLSKMADETPELVHSVVHDVRQQFEVSFVEMMGSIHSEGMALDSAVSAERQAAVEAIDKQRAAVAADAARLSSQIISEAGKEGRRLVGEVLLLVIALAVVILGLPFVAGYLVGRAHRRA